MINEAPSARTADGRELEACRRHLDLAEDDPVRDAAQGLVAALIESRWSLSAAVVVVALRRLCEAVTGTHPNAWPPMLPFLDGIADSAAKAASDGDVVPLASVVGALHRPAASCDQPARRAEGESMPVAPGTRARGNAARGCQT